MGSRKRFTTNLGALVRSEGFSRQAYEAAWALATYSSKQRLELLGGFFSQGHVGQDKVGQA